jgi:hypothetical protein
LYRSDDAGKSFRSIYTFPPPAKAQEEEEEPANDLFVAVSSHDIAVAAAIGRQPDTVAVAVRRPNSDVIELTTAQLEGTAAWTSKEVVVPGWKDVRLTGGTTASPAWQRNTGNKNFLFVSSVALPLNGNTTTSPRIAYIEVGETGFLKEFTKCQAKDLPDTPINRILVDGTTIYAATWWGVYMSIDDCATFQVLAEGLPNVQVRDLYMLPKGDKGEPAVLRAGTYGRGVWEVELA